MEINDHNQPSHSAERSRKAISQGCVVFATGVIHDPVEFPIFAYVDTWAGLGGWGGDDDVAFTCTHVTCYALDVSCTCTHVTCYGLGNQSLNVAL